MADHHPDEQRPSDDRRLEEEDLEGDGRAGREVDVSFPLGVAADAVGRA
ncbi:MAG: hypothetical protein ABEH58_00760 [Haloplanus sp.]